MSAAQGRKESDSEDTAFFNALYEEHHRVLYAYLLGHAGNAETAADLLQETFVRVWQHIQDVRQVPADRRRFWLFATARNLLHDHHRRQEVRSRYADVVLEACVTARDAGDPANAAIAQETALRVDQAMARLPLDQRMALTMHLVGGMNSVEIGQALGRPAVTVRGQIARARQRIARELGLDCEPVKSGEISYR